MMSSSIIEAEARLIVKDAMKGRKYVFFYRSLCHYSMNALAHLEKKFLKPSTLRTIDLQEISTKNPQHYAAILSYLKTNYGGISTVPQLYENGVFFGDSQKILKS